MKLTDIANGDSAVWQGYTLPQFDIPAVKEKTYHQPTWLHFGAGNIFRAFPAAVLQHVLDEGTYDRGVIVAEGFDTEIIDRAYRPYDNLSLLAVLRADGTVEKRVIASVTESLKADEAFQEDWSRLIHIFKAPSLQMVSFTITEKGYVVTSNDLARGLHPQLMMGKVTALLYSRFLAGALPITLQSMDNCSHNGEKVKEAVLSYAEAWAKDGLVPDTFVHYLQDAQKLSYPWSMIDKITPRPDPNVQELLAADGFEDRETIVTAKQTFTAPFVNAEETEYLVVEDSYTNSRPPLEKGGVIYTNRETVDKVETMKVCTCLNPLHTALAIFGCLLGHTLISEEMKDPDLVRFVTKLGYDEAMPVVVNPGILSPLAFIDAVLTKRFANPFMPDTPQRIATDTSQKLPIRFGETIKAYVKQGLDLQQLTFLPLVLAGYARYLKGIDDTGAPFTPSPDPLLSELQEMVAPLTVRNGVQDFNCLRKLYARADVFGVDLFSADGGYLGEKVIALASRLFAGSGAVRRTLQELLAEI